jgi:hypothetical protein
MKNLKYQYNLLKKMLGLDDELIELYSIDQLPRMNLPSRYVELINFIIENNKKGKVPTFCDFKNARIFSTDNSLYKVLTLLGDKEIIAFPTIIHLAFLLGKRNSFRMDFSSLPENISTILENYSGKGASSSWEKRFREKLHSENWQKCYFALFYDEGGPVYSNCFRGKELKYKPGELKDHGGFMIHLSKYLSLF